MATQCYNVCRVFHACEIIRDILDGEGEKYEEYACGQYVVYLRCANTRSMHENTFASACHPIICLGRG